ncbi:MAG: MarR family transcriptional regulator, partial [Malacoplasma sp.]|nr:MarR family transcriptional regulator [Malacoplasma sp.]
MNKTKDIKKIFDNSLDIRAIVTFKKTNRKIIQKEQEILKKWNITLTQFGVLKILYHKEKSNVQDLIDSLFTTSGNMTLVLANMEKNNLIKKEKNAKDKR